MSKVVLVLGGTRSGKSEYAEAIVQELGTKVVYLATSRPYGRENRARIAKHRAQRPAEWITCESTDDLLAFRSLPDQGFDVLLVEDLYMWTVNRLIELGDDDSDSWASELNQIEQDLVAEASALVDLARRSSWSLVIVSAEVGLGITPMVRRQRAFRDLLGRVNQATAQLADQVFLLIAGRALELGGPVAPATK